jgi:hypothetical protein
MSAVLFQPPWFTPVNASGRPYPGARLHLYRAGTTTPVTVYADSSKSATLSNPVVANSAGRFDKVYLDPTVPYNYKAVMTTSLGVQLAEADNIPANPLTADMVGQAIYPRSSGEISAGVTPVDYTKPPGHVLRYGINTTPGTTDMRTAIANSLAANDFCDLGSERCAIGSAIDLTTDQQIYGDGKRLASIETIANTYDAIRIAVTDNSGGVSTTDGRRIALRGFRITSQAGIGASNAAIRFDDATSGPRGVVDAYLADLFIGGYTGESNGFKYGFYGDDLVWNNTFERIWFEDNETSVKLIGASNISNFWNGCYFHESADTVQHIYIQHCKQNVWLNCNFGGRVVAQGVYETDNVIRFNASCQSNKFVGCNFEGFGLSNGIAIISLGDGCGADFDSCAFPGNDAAVGATGYYIRANDNSMATVRNCVTQVEGTTGTIYHFGATNLGKIEVYDYQPVATGDPTHKGLSTFNDIGAGSGHIRFHNIPAQQLVSPEYDLDATGTVKDVLLSTDKPIQFGRVHLIYTETTSADAGIEIAVQVDTNSDYTADVGVSTITTEQSKSAGGRTEGTLSTERVAAGNNTVWVAATLNKTGAGKVRAVVDFWYRGGN